MSVKVGDIIMLAAAKPWKSEGEGGLGGDVIIHDVIQWF